LAAEADALLHLLERRRERERLIRGPLEHVEREPLRRPLPDPGQPRELRDEVLDGGAEHGAIVPWRSGHAACRHDRGQSPAMSRRGYEGTCRRSSRVPLKLSTQTSP